MEYIISVVLVIFSALFSGLTLGLLALDTQSLKRRANLGNHEAALIYPIRAKGNLLLTTLLLGNVIVNTTLSIFLGSIMSGVIAGIIATGLIVVFGEIVPQAVISRHALWFGSRTIWFTKFVLVVLYPIAYPIARTLDYFLGKEIPTVYSRHELMEIISEHEDSEHSTVDAEEERIVHGALKFSHLKVKEIMTPISEVVMFDEKRELNDAFFEEVTDHGYSRYPVYRGNRSNIVGILYAKELLTEDEGISIRETEEAFDKDFLVVSDTSFLDIVFTKMLRKKLHLAIVKNSAKEIVGVVSLEDIIEEIIQHEIEDEADDEE